MHNITLSYVAMYTTSVARVPRSIFFSSQTYSRVLSSSLYFIIMNIHVVYELVYTTREYVCIICMFKDIKYSRLVLLV